MRTLQLSPSWGETAASLLRKSFMATHPRVRERFMALALIAEGRSAKEVALRLGRHRGSVETWGHCFNMHGVAGVWPTFRSIPAACSVPRMSVIVSTSPRGMIENSPPLLTEKEGRDMDDLLHAPPSLLTGEGEMIGFDLWPEIQARAGRGAAKQKIARELGDDWKTVRRRLAQARRRPYQRTIIRPALVSPYRAYLKRQVTEVDDKAYRILQELKAQGYAGGYEMVKLAVRPLYAERDRLAEPPFALKRRPDARRRSTGAVAGPPWVGNGCACSSL